jgi:hypothetical protein
VSNKSSLRFCVVLLFAAFASAALVLADAGASGQNSNSSTTEESAQNDNANTAPAPRRGRRGRRGARRAAAADANANMSMEAGTTPETSGAAAAQDDDSRGDLSGEQVDLSGTYAGRIRTTGGHEMSGDAELTITGNSFTLTGEGMTHSGRIYAVLTRGATSAAFYFTDISVGTPPTPLVFNVRARKRGESLTLTPAPFTTNKMTFTSRGRR